MHPKRLIALLLCAMFIFSLAACSGGEKKIVGRWIRQEGGYFATIEFFSDGTYSSSSSNYQGTYSIDGNRIRLTGILVEDKTLDFEVHGDTLQLGDGTYKRDT